MDENITRRGMGGRKRTLLLVTACLVLVFGATFVEIAVKAHRHKPFLGSVFTLAILNINILLVSLLLLLLGRQFVKFYFERKQSPFGAGFRTKLLTAFIGLSIIPAGLLFIIAGGLLSGSVKYWFGPRVENTMRDSIALVQNYKDDLSVSGLRYASSIAQRLGAGAPAKGAAAVADGALREYDLELVELYGARGKPVGVFGQRKYLWAQADRAFVSKALAAGKLGQTAHYRQGDVVRSAAVYRDRAGGAAGLVVVDDVLSPVITNNIADITKFYDEYWSLRTFRHPMTESYMLSFMLMTLVILFSAVWFGLYLSKGITVPITTLAEATQRISRGEYDFNIELRASDEVGALVDSFRRMTRDLKLSRERLGEANATLTLANELLEQRRQFIETVLENVNTGVITIDRAGKISTVNRAAETITGLLAKDFMGRSYREVFESDRLGEIREQVRHMAEQGGMSIERDIQITVNRRTLTLRLFVSTLHDTTTGGYMGILVVFDDLTELIKAQRAAAWKEVARRIAHEVKNPLTPIQLSAQRLRKRYLEGTGDYGQIIEECTGTIIMQVEEMKALVDEFSKFARMPEAVPQPNSLHAIIDEAAALYAGAHAGISIEKEYDASMPVVNVDREQMKRVFMNLFDNAVTAMEGKGAIRIRTAYDKDARSAAVEVADEGTGILPEDRERLFQPYFSKKRSGTGLGLAIVSRIIHDHGGYIRVEGNTPKGAKFIIELPA